MIECYFYWNNTVGTDPDGHPIELFEPGEHPTIPPEGFYRFDNFPSLVRFDAMQFGSPREKTIFAVTVGLDAMPDACYNLKQLFPKAEDDWLVEKFNLPWLLFAEAGAGSGPGCVDWDSDD